MRDGISKKARKVTERLSVVSLGKRGKVQVQIMIETKEI